MLALGLRAATVLVECSANRGRESQEQNVDSLPRLPRTVQSNKKVKQVANIKSQIKRIGTNKKSQERNKAVKSEVRTAIRATRTAIAAGDKEAATTSLVLASKKLDKAASKGVIHKNQAANKKSAIAKKVAAL
jgi:small subunit ribosomal protein S20